ncbi:endothelin-converting enzyme homolog isoform X4 [Dreissena polymorpha]|nr:endothelin-converting enzyme homolog isoform X4 [Dreissena polymorpha]
MASGDIEMTACIEESEPLNENGRANIKMQDAPFADSRAGSEEDMLDYDDDAIFNCDTCRRRRNLTTVEKCLIAFACVCLLVVIILAAHMGGKTEVKPPKKCESKGCLAAASSLLSAMDPSADPCEDFHQYACGGWLRETPIPPGYPLWDRFQELAYKNMFMLKTFIETHDVHEGAPGKVREFYTSCMAESTVARAETLSDFRSLLTSVIRPGPTTFELEPSLLEIHRLNTWPLFQVLVGPDERKPDRNILKIEAGETPFPFGIFKVKPTKGQVFERSSNNSDPVSISPTTKTSGGFEAKDSEFNGTKSTTSDQEYHVVSKGSDVTSATKATYGTTPAASSTESTTRKPHIKDSHPHPDENITELVKDYVTETTELLRLLINKSRDDADEIARELLELEKKISLAHDIDLHVHNRTQAYNSMTVRDLQSKCNVINWSVYLNSLLTIGSEGVRAVSNETEVVVLHEESLERVCVIVEEYSKNETVKRTLQTYVLLALARSMKGYFDLSTFEPDIGHDEEIEKDGEHWRRCTFYTNRALGLATGAIYVNATSLESTFVQADERILKIKGLVEYVKRAFRDYLLRKIWMDPVTKANAEKKLNEIIDKVSYPSFILNTTFLNEFYKEMLVEKDWFSNLLSWRRFTIKNMVMSLNQPFDRTNSWINPPVTVESDYSPVRNDIIFPIALFHLPIYSHDGPSALNFGAIGSLIGHEITHAFDVQGRQYDGQGELRDWWDPITADMFKETTVCMKDQYDHFKVHNMTVNGEQTLEENIADNGGLRAAHVAFELWMKEQGEELPLAGLQLDNRQIFYISFAQLYCSKWKESGITDFLARDHHSPGPFRIEGALSNNLAFQDVFKCPYTSRYNPSLKCQVW